MSSITTAVAADYRLQQWVQLVKVWIYTTLKLDLSNFDTSNVFYHMNLHYSQTHFLLYRSFLQFFYHMNLHYSQTFYRLHTNIFGFSTIWIYTTLKLPKPAYRLTNSFSTIWIYTTLKLCFVLTSDNLSFFYHMNLHYSQTSIFKSCHYEARYISIWLSI